MFRIRSQVIWYLLGGLLLILAGFFLAYGIILPNTLPIILIMVGLIVVLAGIWGLRPAFPSFAVFLLGLVVLGVVASGYTITAKVETYEFTTNKYNVTELELVTTVTTGNIGVSFTSNETMVCKIVFTQFFFPFFPLSEVSVTNATSDGQLAITASATTANAEIILGQTIKNSFNLTTTTGNIQVEIPVTAAKVEEMWLRATTGNIEANILNTTSLRHVRAVTTTGNVHFSIRTSFLSRDCNVQMSAATGNIKIDLLIIKIGCSIIASTNVGNVKADIPSFTTIVYKTEKSIRAQTANYAQPGIKKLNIDAGTNTGNVDITEMKTSD